MTHLHCCNRRDFLLAALAGAAGCATVPETGRSQLLLFPDSQLNRLGVDAYQQVLKKEKISKDPEANALVRRVGERIAAASGKNYDWEYTVIDDPKTINAFCLPGGKIAVYTGILPVTRDDDGLAVVMGHEVAHATARHGAERMSQGTLAQLAAAGGGLALGGGDPQKTKAIMAALGAGAAVGVILPFSRKQESEADRIGLRYMARAGYDPEAAIPFWERMGQAAGGGAGAAAGAAKRPPEFLSTHPSGETRIRQIREWLPEAKAEYRPRS
jgi:predicted Zn-dependent protease